MADPLLPVLSINDESVQADRQQCKLFPTPEAKKIKAETRAGKRDTSPWPVMEKEDTALQEAKRRCRRTQPTEIQYLGQLVLIFGHYVNKTFKWLLENDVGYAKYLVDKHMKEVRACGHKVDIRDRWLKDYLLKYVNYFPQVSSHLAANIDSCTYGIGPFKSFTYKEMYQWYQFHKKLQADQQLGTAQERKLAEEAHLAVRRWLSMKVEDITSNQMKRFRQYILDKEKDEELNHDLPQASPPGSKELNHNLPQASPPGSKELNHNLPQASPPGSKELNHNLPQASLSTQLTTTQAGMMIRTSSKPHKAWMQQ
ncbi:Hypp774 [Branchiostoma lanceolatum]|uniref:Hypp774 protein n=1 Tax=Branchiostoma lanceolatum TaxID=7740 RepID=A0A8J9YLY1_BRALA|nr:Hypp774 [Branchiostoma lanceolatum]